jgi:hypothetical protein
VKSRRHDWTKRLRYVCACSKILEHFSWEFSRNASDQVRHGGALAGRCQSQKQANTPQLIFTYYLRRMLAAGVSKYDPDPMRALASAFARAALCPRAVGYKSTQSKTSLILAQSACCRRCHEAKGFHLR